MYCEIKVVKAEVLALCCVASAFVENSLSEFWISVCNSKTIEFISAQFDWTCAGYGYKFP